MQFPITPSSTLLLFGAVAALVPSSPALSARTDPPSRADRPPVDEVMLELQKKHKQNDAKYDALAKKIEKEVQKALGTTTWTGEGDTARPFTAHPFFTLVDGLSKPAKTAPAKKPENPALLTKYPWSEQLDLVQGLQFGSDRPVPPHANGFIDLNAPPEPFPGFPELLTNHYLYGLHEIVGWQYRVKVAKQPTFLGRGPKDPPVLETQLPGFEAVRVYLQGSLPDVPLFAIPRLTHTLHSRLAERRRSAKGEPAPMDDLLAFFDSRQNGFQFSTPFTKKPFAIALPVQTLATVYSGFVDRFSVGKTFKESGDIPFISIITQQKYAQAFRSETHSVEDLIKETPAAKAALERFWADNTYLTRYRTMIDEIVRAVLSPNLRYPAYLQYLDYPEGKFPDAREIDGAFDVPRKHAILVWAYAGRDPVKLADFLHEKLFSIEACRFPGEGSLPAELTKLVRDQEQDLVGAVAERAAAERAKGAGGEGAAGDYEREFSPHATYLEAGDQLASEYLLHSFHTFNAPAIKLVQDTAYAVVMQELGK